MLLAENKISNQLKSIFTLDIRSLSIMRIGIGLTLLLDLIIRSKDLTAHYTDNGVLPQELLFRSYWNEFHFSFFTITGNAYMQMLLFLLYGVCILVLIAGYRTRIFTILCWLFLISFHNRNPLVHQGGDDLLRLILFWGIFLPWGNYFSIDYIIKKNDHNPNYVFSLAVAGYIFQIFAVYFFSAVLKSSPEWRSEFTALYYALSFDQIVLPISKWIYQFPGLLKILTATVFYLELYAPFLLFLPIFIKSSRTLFFLVIGGLHIGIALTLNVGLFPLISIISMIGILPFENINLVFKKITRNKTFRLKQVFLPGEYDGTMESSLPVSLIAAFSLFYMLLWNLYSAGSFEYFEKPRYNWIGHTFRLDQHWGMFAPGVFKDDGYFIFQGKTESGKEIDILRDGKDIEYKRLEGATGVFKEDRWRKYSENLLFIHNAGIRPYYCNFLMKNWNNDHHDQKIEKLNIIYVKQRSMPDYQTAPETRDVLCDCHISKRGF